VLRRIIALSTLMLALSAAPAFAYTLHTQMAAGSDTTSRKSGGCSIAAGSHDSLIVTCQGSAKATLGYTFTSRYSVHGRPMGWAYAWGRAKVSVAATASGRTIHMTVTVTDGSVTISSACASYYA
jgi:hypothetical protein